MNVLSFVFKFLLTTCFVSLNGITRVEGHGRLLVPIARTSLWRVDSSQPPNYNDNQMFCGGFDVQYNKNNGKCGICGENYSGDRAYERGGKLYPGKLVHSYLQNQLIGVVVEVTANHGGYFQFHLCNVDGSSSEATQECLNKITLQDLRGNTKIPVPVNYTGNIPLRLRLPADVTCNHCVFQWKYNAGNSWGTDPLTGETCVGCGNQENFYGCSDIKIVARPSKVVQTKQVQERTNDADFVKVPRPLFDKLVTELRRLKETEKRYLASLKEADLLQRRSGPLGSEFKLASYAVDDSRRGSRYGGVDDGVQISQETNGKREFKLESYVAPDLDERDLLSGDGMDEPSLARREYKLESYFVDDLEERQNDEGGQISQETDHGPREFKLRSYAADDFIERNIIDGGVDDGTQISQETGHGPRLYGREFKLNSYSVDDLERRDSMDGGIGDGGQISQEGSGVVNREYKLNSYSVDDDYAQRDVVNGGVDDGTQTSQESGHGPSLYRRDYKLKSYAVDDGTQISQESGHGPRMYGREFKLKSYAADDADKRSFYGGDDGGQISQETGHGPREFKLRSYSVDDGAQISHETGHGPRLYGREFKLKSYAAEDQEKRNLYDDGGQISQETSHIPQLYGREFKLNSYAVDDMAQRGFIDGGVDDGTQISQETGHGPREFKLSSYSVDDGAQISQETGHGPRYAAHRRRLSPIRRRR